METKNKHLGKANHFILWRGLFLILFGISAIFWTGATLSALILVFGFFALADGFVLIAMYAKFHHVWGSATLWFGIMSIVVGLCTLLFPSITAIMLAIFIAMRAFIGGILELRMAAHLRKHVAGEILLIINAVLAIFFSIVLIFILFIYPIFGLLILTEVIGLYAVCLGIIFMTLSFSLKSFSKKQQLTSTTEIF